MNALTGKLSIDFRSAEPIYLQIARQIEQLVAQGTLNKGDQLPTVRELATELRINFNTVSRAYRMLDEAELISTQRGRGTYIWEQPSAETAQRLRREGLDYAARHYIEEGLRLGFPMKEIIQSFERQVQAWNNQAESTGTASNENDMR